MTMGVRKHNEAEYQKRIKYMQDLFEADVRVRKARGFVDPPLGVPSAQVAFKKEFGVEMNSQRTYNMRDAIFKASGLDKKGRPHGGGQQPLPLQGVPTLPTKGQQRAQEVRVANRDPDDPLFHVAMIKADTKQGEFLRDAIQQLQAKGFVLPEVRVDAVTEHYTTVSCWPASPAG